jgi:hypothetical protein
LFVICLSKQHHHQHGSKPRHREGRALPGRSLISVQIVTITLLCLVCAIPYGLRCGVGYSINDLICPLLTVPLTTLTARFEPKTTPRECCIQSTMEPLTLIDWVRARGQFQSAMEPLTLIDWVRVRARVLVRFQSAMEPLTLIDWVRVRVRFQSTIGPTPHCVNDSLSRPPCQW